REKSEAYWALPGIGFCTHLSEGMDFGCVQWHRYWMLSSSYRRQNVVGLESNKKMLEAITMRLSTQIVKLDHRTMR
ncbi:hypothetical protein BSL78_18174, partial [Apostichopus japonicus]